MSDQNPSSSKRYPRVRCFDRVEDERAFDKAFVATVAALNKQTRQAFMSDSNVLRFNHGRLWGPVENDESKEIFEHSISTEWSIGFEHIAENNLGLIEKIIGPTVESMDRQFSENVYSTMSTVAERVGNVVDARAEGSISASFLAMLKKIEFGVDHEGNVSLPQIHVGTGMAERIMSELENQPPEVREEFERIKAEKTLDAMRKEAERKARFKKMPS